MRDTVFNSKGNLSYQELQPPAPEHKNDWPHDKEREFWLAKASPGLRISLIEELQDGINQKKYGVWLQQGTQNREIGNNHKYNSNVPFVNLFGPGVGAATRF